MIHQPVLKLILNLEINLLTDINMCKAKSIESFTTEKYENVLFMQSQIGERLL